MGRPPKAKQLVLEAAQRLVAARGAGCLTFEELALESGISRGGITYHFHTKEHLLRALLHQDLEQWQEEEARLAPTDTDPCTANVIANIRAATQLKPERRRFVSGMLSAVMLDQSLLESVRDFHNGRIEDLTWCETDMQRFVLRLAADGLFWLEMFQCYDLPPDVRKRLVALLEKMARDLAETPVDDTNTGDPT
jgi:AcrR family transcriptional regulator